MQVGRSTRDVPVGFARERPGELACETLGEAGDLMPRRDRAPLTSLRRDCRRSRRRLEGSGRVSIWCRSGVRRPTKVASGCAAVSTDWARLRAAPSRSPPWPTSKLSRAGMPARPGRGFSEQRPCSLVGHGRQRSSRPGRVRAWSRALRAGRSRSGSHASDRACRSPHDEGRIGRGGVKLCTSR